MKKTYLTRIIVRLVLLVVVSALMARAQHLPNPYPGILNTPIDGHTVVRFFFHPPVSDRFVYPLVFRVAAEGDEEMKTAPLLTEGRTAYISSAEMKDLVAAITRSITMGQQTNNVEVLGSWEMIPVTDSMDVVVIFSKGAARGEIPRKDICKTLSSLATSVNIPRARWEFDRFRMYNACRVPGFDDTKYSDH
jgi:hypothetical protein